MLPLLYLHGRRRLRARARAVPRLLRRPFPATVTRLTTQWQADHKAFGERDLSATDYVYVWADGIHLRIRLEETKAAVLVVMGVRADGTKEPIAMADGYRESTESWASLLRDAARRGMRAPVLAVGDGALGFWNALHEVFPETRHQRCWVHKTANVLDSLPKSAQPAAKKAIQDICNAEDKEHAARAVKAFEKQYKAKFPKAVKKITDNEAELLAFYDFPAEHWIHLRTTNPIESTFATVRLRTKVTKGAGSRGRPGDGVQARRVRPGTMAGRQRTPPRRPGESRSPLRTRRAPRTPRDASGIKSDHHDQLRHLRHEHLHRE
ncbi:IS256 family transposase [Streptomyces sp. NBC_01445]|nr:IS256 family transposase [Streptomyces sp. NBC_01445]WSE09219.1 IS256 family transposase [Streptomyces sp. NBC_01445]